MNAASWTAVIALALIVFLAIRYLIREKRKGSKCIGCPYAGECRKYNQRENPATGGGERRDPPAKAPKQRSCR